MNTRNDTGEEDVGHAHDVFISYARADDNHPVANARLIAAWLENEGYDVWWDREMLFGDADQQLERKASRAKCVLLLWSPNAEQSKYVFAEALLAANRGTLAPVIIEDHPLPDNWRRYQNLTLTDLEAQKADLRRMLPPPSRRRERPAPPENERISLTALPTGVRTFIGREDEQAKLVSAWASTAPGTDPAAKTNVFLLHAIGGAGKSALVRQFLDTLADRQFEGTHKVYAWSAYSQGSGDNRTTSADEFIAKALEFFGYHGTPITDAVERGRKLAALVSAHRSLLILDGLEPLQDMPHINGGRLKDRGLAALIKGLADHNNGLLLLTSRQELPELPAKREPRVIADALDCMTTAEGVALLAALGVDGKRTEMEHAVEEVLGHALSLNLLGTYLSAVHGGDVNQREQFRLGEIEDADADFVGDQTARYAKRAARILEGTLDRLGEVEASILHMVGLFDQPAEREALDAVLAEPAIPGLTEAFHGLTAAQRKARWNVAVERLRKLELLSGADRHAPGSLDAHPIVRAHFGNRLKIRAPESYREAHSRLYDYYCVEDMPQAFHTQRAYKVLTFATKYIPNPDENDDATEPDLREVGVELMDLVFDRTGEWIGSSAFNDALAVFWPKSVEGMRPCFAAIAHGCAAKRHQEAFDEVYLPRVMRGGETFIISKLGAKSSTLAAVAPFFDVPWGTPAAELDDETKATVLNNAASALRSLGRLRDTIEPFDACRKADAARGDWGGAALNSINLSIVYLVLGDIAAATDSAENSVLYADADHKTGWRVGSRTTQANALHQSGKAREASATFAEAEAMRAEMQPGMPKLYSVGGYQYCDLLLAAGQPQAASERYHYMVSIRQPRDELLDFALEELVAGRAHAAFCPPSADAGHAAKAQTHLGTAVDGLRRAGDEDFLPWGLLARAAFCRAQGAFSAAATDLDEAFDIAARGDMRLHLADCHLETARLALAQITPDSDATGLRAAAEIHHAQAAALIAATGYNRRLAELAAIRFSLDGAIPAHVLAPDRDAQGRPIWHDLVTPASP